MNDTSKNVVICANPEKGHFFDANQYDVCPVCGAEKMELIETPKTSSSPSLSSFSPKSQKGVFGLFGRKNKESKKQIKAEDINSGFHETYNSGDTPTLDLKSFEKHEAEIDVHLEHEEKNEEPDGNCWKGIAPDNNEDKKTSQHDYRYDDRYEDQGDIRYGGQNNENHGDSQDGEQKANEPDDRNNKHAEGEESGVNDDKPVSVAATDNSDQKKAEENTGALADVIKKASASSEGKTMSYFDSTKMGAGKEERKNIDPVVGWLVCIEGAHFGESFNISAGVNSIGRNNTNRIVLSLDNSISREKHAFVTYEPKKRVFYAKPDGSSGLTYVNDEYITETQVLKSMDIIEMGKSKFIFVPLCSESFSWEDYITKE